MESKNVNALDSTLTLETGIVVALNVEVHELKTKNIRLLQQINSLKEDNKRLGRIKKIINREEVELMKTMANESLDLIKALRKALRFASRLTVGLCGCGIGGTGKCNKCRFKQLCNGIL